MAFRIPQNKVDEIYAAADIVDVVGEFVQLKKRGSNFFGLSPWTTEKSPSFSVSPSKNIFKDFSSGRGGNAVTFLMELEGMTYVEALQWLAKRYGIPIEIEEFQHDKSAEDKSESLYILNEFAARWFMDQMYESEEGKRIGLSYFRERGLLESTLKTFQLGYSPEAWDAFAKAAAAKQFREDLVVESGLCFRSEKDGRVLDRYRERIIFPIHNHLGKAVGFAGRIIGKKEGVAKYVNSPETPVYHKSKILYGLHQNKQHIRDQDQALMVEGYMDLISLWQNGVRNVVASSGTALTEEQIRLLKRFTKNVLLVYDADPAGIRAALRGVDLLLEHELKVKVLVLPEGHDPDSFVQEKGQSGFEQYQQEHAKDFIEFKIRILSQGRNLKDPAQRAELVRETAETLARIGDSVMQGIYIAFVAERIGVNETLVHNAVKEALLDRAKQERRTERLEEAKLEREREKTGQPAQPQVTAHDREILRLLVNYPEEKLKPDPDQPPVTLLDYIALQMDELSLEDNGMEELRLKLDRHYREKNTLRLDTFIEVCDALERSLLTSLLVRPEEVSKGWEQFDIRTPGFDENLQRSADSALMHFRLRKVKKLIRENQEKIRATRDEQQLNDLIHMHEYLNKLKKQISEALGIVVNE